jgi:hypothetical protein
MIKIMQTFAAGEYKLMKVLGGYFNIPTSKFPDLLRHALPDQIEHTH